MSARYAKRRLSTHGLSYIEQGSGPPIIMLHGVGLCADVWMPQQRILARNHTVLSVDLPGHGSSSPLALDVPNLDDYADELERSLVDLVNEPAILVGHSLGALLAIRLINSAQLRVSRAVLLSCIHQRSVQARDAAQHRARSLIEKVSTDPAASTLERWFGRYPSDPERGYESECRRWLTHAYHRGYGAAYRVFASQWGPSDEDLKSLTMPTLFVTGSRDQNSTQEMSIALAGGVPDGCAHIIKGGAHMIGMTHADQVNSVLSEFCAQC